MPMVTSAPARYGTPPKQVSPPSKLPTGRYGGGAGLPYGYTASEWRGLTSAQRAQIVKEFQHKRGMVEQAGFEPMPREGTAAAERQIKELGAPFKETWEGLEPVQRARFVAEYDTPDARREASLALQAYNLGMANIKRMSAPGTPIKSTQIIQRVPGTQRFMEMESFPAGGPIPVQDYSSPEYMEAWSESMKGKPSRAVTAERLRQANITTSAIAGLPYKTPQQFTEWEEAEYAKGREMLASGATGQQIVEFTHGMPTPKREYIGTRMSPGEEAQLGAQFRESKFIRGTTEAAMKGEPLAAATYYLGTTSTKTDPFGLGSIYSYVTGGPEELKRTKAEALRELYQRGTTPEGKAKPFWEGVKAQTYEMTWEPTIIPGVSMPTFTSPYIDLAATAGIAKGVGATIKSVGLPLISAVPKAKTAGAWAAKQMALHPTITKSAINALFVVPEGIKAGQMAFAGEPPSKIGKEISMDLLKAGAFYSGFKSGFEKGLPIKYGKFELTGAAPSALSKEEQLLFRQLKASPELAEGSKELTEFMKTFEPSKTLIESRVGRKDWQHAVDIHFVGEKIAPMETKTFYRGLYAEVGPQAYPLIGKIPEGWAVGSPRLNVPKEMLSGFAPSTALDVRLVKATGYTIETPGGVGELPKELENIWQITSRQKSAFISEPAAETRTLGAKGTKEVYSAARQRRTWKPWTWRRPSTQIYGSAADYPQLKLPSRLPGDIDIQLIAGRKAAEAYAKKLVGKLKKAGETVRATESGEPGTSGVGPEMMYGYKLGYPSIKIRGGQFMPLSEQSIRKAGSAATIQYITPRLAKKYAGFGLTGLKTGKLYYLPEPHRLKDITDFPGVAKTLIESAERSWMPKKGIKGAKKSLAKFEEAYPGLKPEKLPKLPSYRISQRVSRSMPSISASAYSPRSLSRSYRSASRSVSAYRSPSSASVSPSPYSFPSVSAYSSISWPSVSSGSPSPSPPSPSPSPSSPSYSPSSGYPYKYPSPRPSSIKMPGGAGARKMGTMKPWAYEWRKTPLNVPKAFFSKFIGGGR